MILGCKTLLNVLVTDNLTERERLFTYKSIDAYRLQSSSLPLLDGATRAYVMESTGNWYIQGMAKSYPLDTWAHEYEPYALDVEHCYKLVIYLKDDNIPALLYNTVKALLQRERREVWIVDEHAHEQESQYYLYKIEPVELFGLTLLQFLPVVESDIDRDADDTPVEYSVNVTLIRTQPIVA